MSTESALNLPPILDSIRSVLPEGVRVYLVGGALRDSLLGHPSHDLDFVVERDAIRLARRVADRLHGDFYALDPERDTGRVILKTDVGPRTRLDFAAFRGPDLAADLFGRDFTLNAIAMDLAGTSLYDPTGGGRDLRQKQLRTCSATSCSDDPVRILRGVRLAAEFGFRILPETSKAMKAASTLLGKVSPERLRDELFRILDGRKPAACLRSLDRLGALDQVLPELGALKGVEQVEPHIHDVWEHTLAGVNRLETILAALVPHFEASTAEDLFSGLLVMRLGRFRPRLGEDLSKLLTADRSVRSLLLLAALYHDVAKPEARKLDGHGRVRFWDHDQQGAGVAAARARELALSNEEIHRLETIIRNHMRILQLTNRLLREQRLPSRRAVYRFYRDTGPAGVDICLLALADLRATYEENLPQATWVACLDVVRILLENWYEKPGESVDPPPLLDGDDLMRELNLPPGRQIGDLLEAIREAQAMGEVSTSGQALELARGRISQEAG